MSMIEHLLNRGYYLGGSRRMHQRNPDLIPINDNTDWDLYKQDSPEERSWLVAAGFILVIDMANPYCDNLLAGMYKHPDYPLIEVLLRIDANLYHTTFESIRVSYFRENLWKSHPDRLNYSVGEKRNFKTKVRKYFNHAFQIYAWRNPSSDEIPF